LTVLRVSLTADPKASHSKIAVNDFFHPIVFAQYEHMFLQPKISPDTGVRKSSQRLLAGADMAVEFATLGSYRVVRATESQLFENRTDNWGEVEWTEPTARYRSTCVRLNSVSLIQN